MILQILIAYGPAYDSAYVLTHARVAASDVGICRVDGDTAELSDDVDEGHDTRNRVTGINVKCPQRRSDRTKVIGNDEQQNDP